MDATNPTDAKAPLPEQTPIEAPIPKIMDSPPPLPVADTEGVKSPCSRIHLTQPQIKCICFLPWSIWATFTTILACPILFCTVAGNCGRDNYGHPTYPICLADIQCCEYMCCKCKEGRY